MPVTDSATLFGRCIAAIRHDLGLTQLEFATRVGISRQAITHVEAGRTTLSFFALVRIGERLTKERKDHDTAALFSLFRYCAVELSRAGIRVRNRPRRPGDESVSVARVDRVVAHVFDRRFREYIEVVPVDGIDILEEDDDE